MADYDVAIAGGGHNGLVCGAYLAQAGLRVAVFEKRASLGGATATEELWPGHRVDLGGAIHVVFRTTGIAEELELQKHGLHYLEMDPLFFCPFPDGSHFILWRDVEKSCESIAAVSPVDVDRYLRFQQQWQGFADFFSTIFGRQPSLGALIGALGQQLLRPAPGPAALLKALSSRYGTVLRNYFADTRVQSALAWPAAQSGVPPQAPQSGAVLMWHPMYHLHGMPIARGGSSQLTESLARKIRSHAGEVFTGAGAHQVRTEQGQAVALELEDGRSISCENVVLAVHLHEAVALMGTNLAPRWRQRLSQARAGNGGGMAVRLSVSELPNYLAAPSEGQEPAAHHRAIQLLCPSLEYLEDAYRDFERGNLSARPALTVSTPSAIDGSLAPSGRHSAYLWGQYYPYDLPQRESWENIAEREADKMMALVGEYAPNLAGAVRERLVETPLYFEQELGLRRGNIMHLEMTPDQTLWNRPARGMSGYRTPIGRLYLCGASTHPGGGIVGTSGKLAAAALLRNYRKA